MGKRILFTGGSGKAGRHVVPWLAARGHRVVNFDLEPLDAPGIDTLIGDVTDSGQVFNALHSYGNLSELDDPQARPRFDAVVHFAAIPRILIRPDNETFRVNAMGTYNVLEAATRLGIRKVVVASSETTYGICFAEGHRDPAKLPIEEDDDVNPEDSYAMSKVVNERCARAFQTRSGADIYALRIGNVIEPHEYDRFPTFFANPEMRLRNAFNYVDARDLGQIVDLCLGRDGLGFQIFNAANDTNSSDLPTAELIRRFYRDVPVTRSLGEYEALYSNRKAREVLGFREEHDWRRYVPGHG